MGAGRAINRGGDPRTGVVDVPALGTFSSGKSMTIDKNTNATSGLPNHVPLLHRRYRSRGRLWGDLSKVEALASPFEG